MNLFTRRAPLIVAVLVTGCLIAACGSSSSTSTKSAAASASSSASGSGGARGSRFSALRTCLQQHGVTLPTRRSGSGPPPGGGPPGGGAGAGGGFFGGGGGGGLANNPKLRAAMKACGGGGNFRGGQRSRLSSTRINAYVACVRQHGYNIPNPNLSGKGAVFPSNIRTNPKFQSASKACQSLLVPSRPGGGGTSTSGTATS